MLVPRRMKRLPVLILTVLLIVIVTLYCGAANNGFTIDSLELLRHGGTGRLSSFVKSVNQLTEKLKDKDVFQRYVLDLNAQLDTKIKLPSYLVEPSEFKNNPHIQTFDPRFTFGMIVNDLKRQLEENENDKESALSIDYFHWADWVDLSMIDEHLLTTKDKTTCEQYFRVIPGKKEIEVMDPKAYCIDHANLQKKIDDPKTDAVLKQKLLHIQQRAPYSANVHVFRQGGRSRESKKVFQSKLYLQEFMDPPSNVVLLFPPDASKGSSRQRGVRLQVNQDWENRKQLIDTPVVERYVSSQKKQQESDEPAVGEKPTKKQDAVYLDVRDEINSFKAKIEDTNQPTPKPLSYEIKLSEDLFEDQSEKILKELNAQVESGVTLSPMDERYRQTLEFSTQTQSAYKYFYEAKLLKVEKNWVLGAHYDWRFFNGLVNGSEKSKSVLYGLMRAWLTLTQAYELKTWIAHGSLLSWYWNGVSFPWDNDIDVQMPISDLHKLSQLFNQSIIVDVGDTSGGLRFGRYFVDCGSFISQRHRGKGYNNIDARFIDLDTGLYIDITGIAVSETKAPARYDGGLSDNFESNWERNKHGKLYNCRNNHFSRLNEISPLRLTSIDGLSAYIVHDYENVLTTEYKDRSIVNKRYRTKTFVSKLGLFVDHRDIDLWAVRNKENAPQPLKLPAGRKSNRQIRDFDPYGAWSEKNWIDFLNEHPQYLSEYYLTNALTSFHKVELNRIEDKKSTQNLLLTSDGQFTITSPAIRHDYWSYLQVERQSTFNTKIDRTLNLLKEVKAAAAEPEIAEPEIAEPEIVQPNEKKKEEGSKGSIII